METSHSIFLVKPGDYIRILEKDNTGELSRPVAYPIFSLPNDFLYGFKDYGKVYKVESINGSEVRTTCGLACHIDFSYYDLTSQTLSNWPTFMISNQKKTNKYVRPGTIVKIFVSVSPSRNNNRYVILPLSAPDDSLENYRPFSLDVISRGTYDSRHPYLARSMDNIPFNSLLWEKYIERYGPPAKSHTSEFLKIGSKLRLTLDESIPTYWGTPHDGDDTENVVISPYLGLRHGSFYYTTEQEYNELAAETTRDPLSNFGSLNRVSSLSRNFHVRFDDWMDSPIPSNYREHNDFEKRFNNFFSSDVTPIHPSEYYAERQSSTRISLRVIGLNPFLKNLNFKENIQVYTEHYSPGTAGETLYTFNFRNETSITTRDIDRFYLNMDKLAFVHKAFNFYL